MKLILSFLLLSLSISIVSCKQPTQRVQNSAADKVTFARPDSVLKINVAIKDLASKYDPYCEMPLSQKSLEDTALINGKIYGYCSSGCKEEHAKELAEIKKIKKASHNN